MLTQRTHKRIETAVTMGIAEGLLSGMGEAARTMRQAGVPFHVALRVLVHPRYRRATDWQH